MGMSMRDDAVVLGVERCLRLADGLIRGDDDDGGGRVARFGLGHEIGGKTTTEGGVLRKDMVERKFKQTRWFRKARVYLQDSERDDESIRPLPDGFTFFRLVIIGETTGFVGELPPLSFRAQRQAFNCRDVKLGGRDDAHKVAYGRVPAHLSCRRTREKRCLGLCWESVAISKVCQRELHTCGSMRVTQKLPMLSLQPRLGRVRTVRPGEMADAFLLRSD